MKFNPKSEYDFLKNEEFVLWVNHQRVQDTEMWHKWLLQNPDKSEYFHKSKAIINSFQYSGDEKIDELRLNTILENLSETIGSKSQRNLKFKNKPHASKWQNYKWAVAASVLLVIVLGALSWTYLKTGAEKDENLITVFTDRGERKTVMLPDGSSVILDSYSSIEYSSDFEKARQVKLDGRAFFEVKKQNGKPFEVISKGFDVVVLGTSFDMNTDQNRGDGHVALVTGQVNVTMGNGKKVNLEPDQAAYISFETNEISKGTFDSDQILGWRTNILKFKDESYQVVFERIANWYGVEFIYNENINLEGLYSATYQNQKLDEILQGLSYSTDLKFEIKSNEVYVSQ